MGYQPVIQTVCADCVHVIRPGLWQRFWQRLYYYGINSGNFWRCRGTILIPERDVITGKQISVDYTDYPLCTQINDGACRRFTSE